MHPTLRGDQLQILTGSVPADAAGATPIIPATPDKRIRVRAFQITIQSVVFEPLIYLLDDGAGNVFRRWAGTPPGSYAMIPDLVGFAAAIGQPVQLNVLQPTVTLGTTFEWWMAYDLGG